MGTSPLPPPWGRVADYANAEFSSIPKVRSGHTRAIGVSDECTTHPYSEAAYNGNSEDRRLFGTSPPLAHQATTRPGMDWCASIR